MQIEITDRAYLIIPAEMCTKYFPTDNLVALPRAGELWLLPVSNKASGGLLMKRRNLKGDRSVLLIELVEEGCSGFYEAHWDETHGAVRVLGISNRSKNE
ncbi:MAG TPA: hypothetical protein V6C97_02170 [Oculatellaceae cyanobacterium]